MSPNAVRGLLAYITAAFPWFDAGEATEHVWGVALDRFHDDEAADVASRVVASVDSPPSIKRVIEELQKLRRENYQSGPAIGDGALPVATSSGVAKAMAAGMRAAAKDVPEHRNHTKAGGQNCPACSTRSQRKHVPGEVMQAISESLAAGGSQ